MAYATSVGSAQIEDGVSIVTTQLFSNWIYVACVSRPKTATAASNQKRLQILQIIRENGPLTQGELAKIVKLPWGTLQWHLYVLEREGKIKRFKKSGFEYYAAAGYLPACGDDV